MSHANIEKYVREALKGESREALERIAEVGMPMYYDEEDDMDNIAAIQGEFKRQAAALLVDEYDPNPGARFSLSANK